MLKDDQLVCVECINDPYPSSISDLEELVRAYKILQKLYKHCRSEDVDVQQVVITCAEAFDSR